MARLEPYGFTCEVWEPQPMPRADRHNELVTSDTKILTVALDSGFGSLSRFNAAFRSNCGCSPRAYRAMHRL